MNITDKKLYIFDQDGTIYLDNEILPGSKELIQKLNELDKTIVFVSNNSSQSIETYSKKLTKILDMKITKDQIYTSTSATIDYLKQNGVSKIYPIGTPEFEIEVGNADIELTEENPELIVLAFDKTLTYDKLEKVCYLIQDGVEYIATHPDINCPTKRGFIPDVGSFIALIEKSTGKLPSKIIGKPNAEMVNVLLNKFNLNKEDAIMFGDRIYTDMKMAENAEISSALMLTGEATREDVEKSEIKPDYIFENMKEVLKSFS